MAISDQWEIKAIFGNISCTHSHNIKALFLKWTFLLYPQRKRLLSSYLKITASCELWTHVSCRILLPWDLAGSSISDSFSLFLSMCYSLHISESPVFDPTIPSNFPSSFFLVNFSSFCSFQVLSLPDILILVLIQDGVCSQIRLKCLRAEQIAFLALCSIILDLCCVALWTILSFVIFSPTLIFVYQILGVLLPSFGIAPYLSSLMFPFYRAFLNVRILWVCPSNPFLQELVDYHLQYISLVYMSSPDLTTAISISLSQLLIW